MNTATIILQEFSSEHSRWCCSNDLFANTNILTRSIRPYGHDKQIFVINLIEHCQHLFDFLLYFFILILRFFAECFLYLFTSVCVLLCSMDKVGEHRRGQNVWFYKTGLGKQNIEKSASGRGWRMRNLQTIIEELNDTAVSFAFEKNVSACICTLKFSLR